MTAHAQVWANQIAATGVVEHDTTIQGSEGENIAWFKGQDDSDCIDSVTLWYDDEEPLYDYNNPGFSPQTGHFTQLVWKSTSSVGVALASTGSGNNKKTYVVARYYPPGNVVGFFPQNVEDKQNSG